LYTLYCYGLNNLISNICIKYICEKNSRGKYITHTTHFIPWMSNGYPGDVQVSTCPCVRSYGRNGNVLKYHIEVRNTLLFHYYVLKMNYF